jgi:hypothetical protein
MIAKKLESIIIKDFGKYKPDVIALYFAYYLQKDKNNLSELHVPRAATFLGISERRVRKAKQLLTDAGYISAKTVVDNRGTLRHFTELTK